MVSFFRHLKKTSPLKSLLRIGKVLVREKNLDADQEFER